MLFEDQLAALEADSKKVGTQGGESRLRAAGRRPAAEREQGITIDVAYRFFSPTSASSSSPTRPATSSTRATWSTGASTADLAIILIDARKGVLTQTRRHSYLVARCSASATCGGGQQDGSGRLRAGGVRRASSRIPRIRRQIGIRSRRDPDVGAHRRQHHRPLRANALVHGPTLMGYLETVEIDETPPGRAVPHAGAVGQPAQPRLPRLRRHDRRRHGAPGDGHPRAASGKHSTVARIVTKDGDLHEAVAGQSSR
jgi:bifunctional enzyme CysN/CysC